MPMNSKVRRLAARKLAGVIGSACIVFFPSWFLTTYILETFGSVGCLYSMLMAPTPLYLYLGWAWAMESARQELDDLASLGYVDNTTRER